MIIDTGSQPFLSHLKIDCCEDKPPTKQKVFLIACSRSALAVETNHADPIPSWVRATDLIGEGLSILPQVDEVALPYAF